MSVYPKLMHSTKKVKKKTSSWYLTMLSLFYFIHKNRSIQIPKFNNNNAIPWNTCFPAKSHLPRQLPTKPRTIRLCQIRTEIISIIDIPLTEPDESSKAKQYQHLSTAQLLLPLRNMQLRQIKPNPSGRKTNLLLLIHTHARVIALKEVRVDTLGAGILSKLFSFLDADGSFLVCFWD